jgi:hypothetical protein
MFNLRNGLTKYKTISMEFSKALKHPIDVFYDQENDCYICFDGHSGEQIMEFETGKTPEVSQVEIHFQKLGRRQYWEDIAKYKKKVRDASKVKRGSIKEYADQFRKDGRLYGFDAGRVKVEGSRHSIVVPDMVLRERK